MRCGASGRPDDETCRERETTRSIIYNMVAVVREHAQWISYYYYYYYNISV